MSYSTSPFRSRIIIESPARLAIFSGEGKLNEKTNTATKNTTTNPTAPKKPIFANLVKSTPSREKARDPYLFLRATLRHLAIAGHFTTLRNEALRLYNHRTSKRTWTSSFEKQVLC